MCTLPRAGRSNFDFLQKALHWGFNTADSLHIKRTYITIILVHLNSTTSSSLLIDIKDKTNLYRGIVSLYESKLFRFWNPRSCPFKKIHSKKEYKVQHWRWIDISSEFALFCELLASLKTTRIKTVSRHEIIPHAWNVSINMHITVVWKILLLNY